MNKYIKLGDVATFMNGYAFKPADWEEQGLPIIRIQNLTSDNKNFNYYNKNYDPKYEINKGDILISWSASLGVYEWQGEKALLNQHIFKVVFDKMEVDKRFFIYAVKILLKNIENNLHGSTMKHITKPMFESLKFPALSLEKQRKIANVLDCVSNILNMKKSQFNSLTDLSKFQFLKIFGDPILNEKNWNISSFGNNFKISSGGTPSTQKNEYWENGNISWIGSNMCQDKIIYKNDGKFITELGYNNSSAKIFKENTILVALVGATIGKTALLKFKTTTNQNVAGIEITNNDFIPEFVFYLLQKLYVKFQNLGNGNFKMANLTFIKGLPLIVPPIELQNKFADFVVQTEKCLFGSYQLCKSLSFRLNYYYML